MRFARLHRATLDPLTYTGEGLWVNFDHVACMSELVAGGTRLAFPVEDTGPQADPRPSPMVATVMPLVQLDVTETIGEILALLA